MSLLIKGMEMPSSCAECGFEVFDRCGAMYGALLPSNYLEDITRPSYCPLVELPPHGDLIDRDAFIKSECIDRDCLDCECDDRCDMIKNLKNAPVVIPSNKEETE